jgi:hypothetical protein
MAMVEVCLEALSAGRALETLNEYLRKIARDVMERSRIEDKRRVTLEISITPQVDEATGINIPEINYKISSSIPGAKGMITRAFIEDGMMKVNTHDPMGADPRQPTLFDETDNVQDIAQEGN